MSRRITTRLLSLAVGLGLSLSLATAASAACQAASTFTLRQKDGFTVVFNIVGTKSATATTKKYGTANATFKSQNNQTKFIYRVHWKHGEVGVYTIFVNDDDFGVGEVHTPDRNVNSVKFTSLNPVRTCS